MAQESHRTARDIANVVPSCPSCGSRCYSSLTENAREGFRLRTLRCELCNCDILAQARQLEYARREPSSAPLIFACLAALIVLEVLALTGLLWV